MLFRSTAVAELRAAIDAGLDEQYVASAHGLLGAALEQQGQMRDAADAYLLAADAAWYPFLAAEYLQDAARTLVAASDTARAVEVYERLLRDHPDSPSAVEGRERLAELQPSSAPSGS